MAHSFDWAKIHRENAARKNGVETLGGTQTSPVSTGGSVGQSNLYGPARVTRKDPYEKHRFLGKVRFRLQRGESLPSLQGLSAEFIQEIKAHGGVRSWAEVQPRKLPKPASPTPKGQRKRKPRQDATSKLKRKRRREQKRYRR